MSKRPDRVETNISVEEDDISTTGSSVAGGGIDDEGVSLNRDEGAGLEASGASINNLGMGTLFGSGKRPHAYTAPAAEMAAVWNAPHDTWSESEH
jgi:hypothetical protein